MTEHLPITVVAVIVAAVVMMVEATPLADFICMQRPWSCGVWASC
jgi:predicted tellurium resistance membrane protein TerC